jgi:hypothetical protein
MIDLSVFCIFKTGLHVFWHLNLNCIFLAIFCILFCIFIGLFYILHIILHIYWHILHIYVEYRPVSILLIFFTYFIAYSAYYFTYFIAYSAYILHIMQWIWAKAGVHRFNSVAQRTGEALATASWAGRMPLRPAVAALPPAPFSLPQPARCCSPPPLPPPARRCRWPLGREARAQRQPEGLAPAGRAGWGGRSVPPAIPLRAGPDRVRAALRPLPPYPVYVVHTGMYCV